LSDALQPPSRSITYLTTAKTAARKIDALLNLSRPMKAVQALDAREFHALIQTAGLDQSIELIELASGEQIQALIDFDGWNRDRLEHKRFADWMMILLGCPDESLHRWFAKLDLEPIIVWMREHAQVFLWEEDRDLLDCVDAPVLTSPDGTYAIMVPDDGEPADIVRMLLDRAYARVTKKKLRITDDAQAVETLDHPIALLENTSPNPKLTTPGDLAYLEFLLARTSESAPASA
jgi:hypothetical protein